MKERKARKKGNCNKETKRVNFSSSWRNAVNLNFMSFVVVEFITFLFSISLNILPILSLSFYLAGLL
jgi:hypothetical protein